VRNTVARVTLVPVFSSLPVLLTGVATPVVRLPAQRASRVYERETKETYPFRTRDVQSVNRKPDRTVTCSG
jgi:hypothetical protein